MENKEVKKQENTTKAPIAVQGTKSNTSDERTKYTTEALAKSGRWPVDFVNAFLNKDKMYTLEEADKLINKTLREKEGE